MSTVEVYAVKKGWHIIFRDEYKIICFERFYSGQNNDALQDIANWTNSINPTAGLDLEIGQPIE